MKLYNLEMLSLSQRDKDFLELQQMLNRFMALSSLIPLKEKPKMEDIDRRLIQDKQDQLLDVIKKSMDQLKEIERLRSALERIVEYDTPDQLREYSKTEYGLDYEEALEMAYENIQEEAKSALSKTKE